MSKNNDPIVVNLPPNSLEATFIQRQKRFLIEVEAEGKRFWAHTNNSGSMLGLLRPGARTLVSPSPNKNRKLSHTLEMIEVEHFWVGVNTSMPNRVLKEAWRQGLLPEAKGYDHLQTEKKLSRSRLDAMFTGPRGTLWVETKNVTLVEDGVACFPDAVTTRGQKHLQELMALRATGERCACFYLVQRPDASCFAPADFIDPVFTELFWQAAASGVEMWVYEAKAQPSGIRIGRSIPLKNR